MCAALVLAQSLGWIHPIVHLPSSIAGIHATDEAGAHHRPVSGHDGHGHEAGSWLASLFGDHEDGTDCRLFDAAGQQVFMASGPAALAAVIPAGCLLRAQAGDFVARWAALFDARGPPAAS